MERTRAHEGAGDEHRPTRCLHARIVRIVASLTSHATDRDDAVQEIWLALLARPPLERGRFDAWIRVVGRRALGRMGASERGRRRRERDVDAPLHYGSTLDVIAEADARENARRRIEALGEPYRTTLALHYVHGATIDEIARAERASPATVRSRLKRGLEHLRERARPDALDA